MEQAEAAFQLALEVTFCRTAALRTRHHPTRPPPATSEPQALPRTIGPLQRCTRDAGDEQAQPAGRAPLANPGAPAA